MRLGNRELRVALIVATGFIGCADGRASQPWERAGDVPQDWSVASCDDSVAIPSEEFTGAIHPAHESTQAYTLCHKSYVVDLHNYGWTGEGGGSSAQNPPPYGAGGGPPLTQPHLKVGWSDEAPTTRADCEASFVGGILYYRGQVDGGDAWLPLTGQVRTYGTWNRRPGPIPVRCTFEDAIFNPLWFGYSYRLAATARNAADETRRMLIETGP